MSEPDPLSPAPSPDAARPAEAFPPFTERPPEPDVWRRAQQDYLCGDTAAVVCERYGLVQSTFFRRATKKGWRRTDVTPTLEIDRPPWSISEWKRSVDVIEDRPEFAQIQASKDNEVHTLLFNPHPDDLRVFAFRRACEAAALHKPGESAAWLRVQRLAEQAVRIPDPSDGPYRPEDYLRASFLSRTSAALRPGPAETGDLADDGADDGSE